VVVVVVVVEVVQGVLQGPCSTGLQVLLLQLVLAVMVAPAAVL
jgi:hypothetical protein